MNQRLRLRISFIGVVLLTWSCSRLRFFRTTVCILLMPFIAMISLRLVIARERLDAYGLRLAVMQNRRSKPLSSPFMMYVMESRISSSWSQTQRLKQMGNFEIFGLKYLRTLTLLMLMEFIFQGKTQARVLMKSIATAMKLNSRRMVRALKSVGSASKNIVRRKLS